MITKNSYKKYQENMEEPGASRSSILQRPERESRLSSPLSAIEGTVKQQPTTGFSNFDTSLHHMEDEASVSQDMPALIEGPHMPTNSGFFTDLLLATAALNPNASVRLTFQTKSTA